MSLKPLFWTAFLPALACLCAGAPAWAEMPSAPAAALLESVRGAVQIEAAGRGVSRAAEAGMMLGRGATLRTGQDATAILKLPDGGRLGLGENSELTLGLLIPKYGERTTLLLPRGLLRWAIQRLRGEEAVAADYEVYTASAVAAVKGTDFEVDCGDDRSTEVRTYSSEHAGVVLSDLSGKSWAFAGPGQALRRDANGNFNGRALSREDYEGLKRWEHFKEPPLPKGLPLKSGQFEGVKPEESAKGADGAKSALALIKGSALEKADPKTAEWLAKEVEAGALGLAGLDRILKQTEANLADLAKLGALQSALGPAANERLQKGPEIAALAADDAAFAGLKDEAMAKEHLEELQTALDKAAQDPQALALAAKALDLDAAKAADLGRYLVARGVPAAAGPSASMELELLDAAVLKPAILKRLADEAEKLAAELAAADAAQGKEASAALAKALAELERFDRSVAGEVVEQTGLPIEAFRGTRPGDKSSETPADRRERIREVIAETREQIREFREDIGRIRQENQRVQVQTIYNAPAAASLAPYHQPAPTPVSDSNPCPLC